MIALTLPYPPSVNHCYSRSTRGTFITPKARAYRKHVAGIVAQANAYEARVMFPVGDLAVRAVLNPPIGSPRDIDNWAKVACDALTHAHVWRDDSQVKLLLTIMDEPVEKGCITLTIATLAEIESIFREVMP